MTKVSIYGAAANKNNSFDIIFIPLANPEEMPAFPVDNGLVNETDQNALDEALLGIEDDVKSELYEYDSKYYMAADTLDLSTIIQKYKNKYEALGFEFSLIYARKSSGTTYYSSDDDIIYTNNTNRINLGTRTDPIYVKSNFILNNNNTQQRINTGTSGDVGIKVAFKRLYVPSELNEKLQEIKEQKSTYLIPENIKAGVTILGVTGTYTGENTEE